jgi:protein-S-isoprenylcysteine O-methyltransferase Ste14
MTKGKSWKEYLSPLLIGHILLITNIGFDIFVKQLTALEWLKNVGLVFIILVVILWFLPVYTLRKYGDINPNGSFLATTQLVDKGIYHLIRHPQYLSFMFLNAGLACINQDTITILISISSIIFLSFGIKEEEHYLVDQFGEEYKAYQEKVPSINIFAGIFRRIKK